MTSRWMPVLCHSLFLLRLWRGRWPRHLGALDDADGAIGGYENLVGDAANVGLVDLVVAVELAEEFAPIAEARLEGGELSGKAGVIAKPADQVGLGAGLEHGQLFVADIGGLKALDLGANGVADFVVGMSGCG